MHLGIDLGGTKIEVAVLDKLNCLQFNKRICSPRGDYSATLNAITELIREAESQIGQKASLGLGIPGTIDRQSQRVKNANSTWLNGERIQMDLEASLGRSIAVRNDADCFTLSESVDGAGSGYNTVFGVILGTGVGGGLYSRGHLLGGPNGIAGEWGHNPLPLDEQNSWPQTQCYCGRRGCIETYLSGPGFSRLIKNSTYAEGFQDTRELSDYDAGSPEKRQICELYADGLAMSLSTVMNIVDPDIIVLGGGLSNMEWIYHLVPIKLDKYVFTEKNLTPIVKAKHGDASGVRGAAWLGKDSYQMPSLV